MMKKGEMRFRFKPIGWHGIELQVPEDWNLAAESGRRQEGLMSVAGDSSKFEIKWGKVEKKKTFSLESASSKYMKKLEKSTKNFKLLKTGSTKIFDHKAIYFYFKAEVEGYGIVWYCDKDEKIFIGLFNFRPDAYEGSRLVFKRFLDSLKCHTLDDWNSWALLGFSFQAPSNFDLKVRKFLVGNATLRLCKEEPHPFYMETAEIVFQYWSPANVRYEKTYTDLERWFEENYEKGLKKLFKGGMQKEKFENFTIKGHEAKTLASTMKRGFLVTHTITRNNTYIWYCSPTNRIYALTLSRGLSKPRFMRKRESEILPAETFDRILSSVSCH